LRLQQGQWGQFYPVVRRAIERLEAALAELEVTAPGWQAEMDLVRASRGQATSTIGPEWCLLPGEAPYAIATANGLVSSEVINMAPVDEIAFMSGSKAKYLAGRRRHGYGVAAHRRPTVRRCSALCNLID
jgi:hypothetical protein